MDAFVDRKARDLPELMVAVRTKRADAIWGERCVIRTFAVYGFKLPECIRFVLCHYYLILLHINNLILKMFTT